MKKLIDTEFSFATWINNDVDSTSDEFGQFDDNWLISADDLFRHLELAVDEPVG